MEHVATGADVGHAVQVDQLAQPEVKRHATDHADRAHRQRQVEAVPHGQAVLGHGRAEDRRGGGMQHRCHVPPAPSSRAAARAARGPGRAGRGRRRPRARRAGCRPRRTRRPAARRSTPPYA
ncbi:hypothetical protein G6F60_015122 [Rhizopus arrhizus]|nr:hypothetical protein G6F60_015122 [Rhizopus arrhizus]